MKNFEKIKRIFISGKPVTVSWTDAFVSEDLGRSFSGYQKIYVINDSDRPIESIYEALWHEILHIISEDYGLKLTEEQVQALGCALTNVFISNFKVEPKPKILKDK